MRHGPAATRARSGNEVPASNDTTSSPKQPAPPQASKNSEGGGADTQSRKQSFLMSIPTALTIVRVCAIPPVVYLVQFPEPSAAAWATTIFVAASITDWLDGYLARKMVCPSYSSAPPILLLAASDTQGVVPLHCETSAHLCVLCPATTPLSYNVLLACSLHQTSTVPRAAFNRMITLMWCRIHLHLLALSLIQLQTS